MKLKREYPIICIVLFCSFLISCNTQSRTLKNGYTLPKATKENVKKVIEKTIDNLVFVEGGNFLMGERGHMEGGDLVYWSPWEDNFPVHKVTLDSFSISKYEVTYWEYDVYTDLMKREQHLQRKSRQYYRKDNYPVGGVSWEAASGYCQWLAKKTGLPVSLPTEAQWEYAARSRGKHVGFATDNGKMDDGRNHRKDGDVNSLYPVGTFPPNPLGLYDMSGNASEWVLDWYDEKYYAKSPEYNPQGAKEGTHKVLRGGSPEYTPIGNSVYVRGKHQIVFTDEERELRTKRREKIGLTGPLDTMYYYGFRCVVNSPNPIKSK